jgi:hypothetical protein
MGYLFEAFYRIWRIPDMRRDYIRNHNWLFKALMLSQSRSTKASFQNQEFWHSK